MNDNFSGDNPKINLNDFSVTSQDHYVTFNYLYLLSRDNDNTENFIIPSDFIPTENSVNISFESQEKVKYGFKFSGCKVLNNVGSLMTRNQYYIKGSRCVNHHTKKLCSVAKCKYIYLLYPEGILFSSLHWKATNEKCSIVGAIPYYLLNLCCIQEGFSSIQQHVCTRLTSTSKAMVSDPIYICHYYYTMENLFASLNDTRLVINHSLTVSEDKHFNLGVRGSVDSSILSSVDIK